MNFGEAIKSLKKGHISPKQFICKKYSPKHNSRKMKVTINFTDFQIMRALALLSSTEKQSEAVMSAVRETPELDITDYLFHTLGDNDAILGFTFTVVAAIAKERNIE